MRSITSLLDFVRVTSLLVVNVLGHVLQLSRKLVVLWVLKLTFTFLTFLWYLCHAAVDSDPVSTHTGAMTEVAVKGPDVNETAAEWSTENAASDPAPPSDPVLTSAAAGTEVDVEGTDVSETAAMWSAAGVGHVFTFRVAFLLLRIKFMHSSFSQTGSRFFWSRFAFRDSTIGYIGKDVSEMLDGIFQIVRIILNQIWRSCWRKGGPVGFRKLQGAICNWRCSSIRLDTNREVVTAM